MHHGAGQTAAGHDLKPQEAMEMLSTCDGRLQALMAEANLLGDAAASQGQTSSEDVELRQAFASVLIESGEAWDCQAVGSAESDVCKSDRFLQSFHKASVLC